MTKVNKQLPITAAEIRLICSLRAVGLTPYRLRREIQEMSNIIIGEWGSNSEAYNVENLLREDWGVQE